MKRTALILHDGELGWAAVQALLQDRDDVRVIGNVRSRDSALHHATAHQIDLLLASNLLEGTPSYRTLSEIRTICGSATLIALFVSNANPEELERLGQVRLAAYCDWAELGTVDAIDAALGAILTGHLVIATRMAACGYFRDASRAMSQAHDSALISNLDRQIITLLAQGLTAQEIALQVRRAPHTVENRLLELRTRLGARNCPQLIHLAHQLRLIHPSNDDVMLQGPPRDSLAISTHDREKMPK